MDERGWSADMAEVVSVLFMRWVGEHQAAGEMPTLAQFVEDIQPLQVGQDAMLAILAGLSDDGLIKIQRTLAGGLTSSALLTDRGRANVHQRERRSQDVQARAIAVRDAVLAWVHKQEAEGTDSPVIDRFFEDPRSYFDGVQFTEQEVRRATDYLREIGLLRGVTAWGAGLIRPTMTAEGRDAVEHYGSVSAYVTRAPAGGQRYTQNVYGGQGAQAGRDVHQTQRSGVDVQALLELVRTIRDAVEGAAPEQSQPILAVVAQVEEEAQSDEPDTSWLRSLLDRLQAVGGRAGNAALAAVITLAVNKAEGKL